MDTFSEQEIFSYISPHINTQSQKILSYDRGAYCINITKIGNNGIHLNTIKLSDSDIHDLKNSLLLDGRNDIHDYLTTTNTRKHTIIWSFNAEKIHIMGIVIT
jgi:hypothetical protein